MGDFQTSTHRASWIFTPSMLEEKRTTVNQKAAQMLLKCGVSRVQVDVDGSFSYPEPIQNDRVDGERHSPRPLKCEEEGLVRVFYEKKIQEVCDAFKFPHKIQATALIYFKRFYLSWSIMEHNPKHVMLTCIYAACKVEENHVSAEEFGKGIQQDHQMILNNEMLVLQTLGFDLIVYSPYRSIEGFLADMEQFYEISDDEQEKFKDLRETAILEADKIMLTDAPLLYPPAQLALVALWRSNDTHGVLDFERYLEYIVQRQQSTHSLQELTEFMGEINFMVSQYLMPSEEEMRHIDRKLRKCQDPSSQHEQKKERKSRHKSKQPANDAQEGSRHKSKRPANDSLER